MVVTTTGKNTIRDLIDAGKQKGQLGTDGTAALESDTGLGTAVAATLVDLSSSTADQQLILDYTCSSILGNGSTMQEFENRLGAGTNFNRVIYTSLAKTSSIEINISTILTIE